MPQWMQDLAAGWPMIMANLPTFFALLMFIIGSVWVVVNWSYSSVLAGKNAQLEMQDRKISDYKEKLGGATPDQAKARIDALEGRLAAIEPRRLPQPRRSKLAADLRSPIGAVYSIAIAAEMSGDSAQYATDIVAAFQEAGNWNVNNSSVVGIGTRPPTGLSIAFADAKQPPQEAIVIMRALSNSNIPFDIQYRPTHRGVDVEILVATKLAP